jgi:transcription-repair coupling factor (superfamily II helicase)
MPESAQALSLWSILLQFKRPVLWIGDGIHALESMHRCVKTLQPSSISDNPLWFPPWESQAGQGVAMSSEILGDRLRAVSDMLTATSPTLCLTAVQALMQKTFTADALSRASRLLHRGDSHDLLELAATLQTAGYDAVAEISQKGEVALRGGIMDVWPPAEDMPVRLDFFGDTLESLRQFDPYTQQSIEELDSVFLCPASEWDALLESGDGVSILDVIDPHTILVWSEYDAITQHAEAYEESLITPESYDLNLSFDDIVARRHSRSFQEFMGGYVGGEESRSLVELDFRPLNGVFDLPREAMEPDLVESMRSRFLTDLQEHSRTKSICIYLDTEGACERFKEGTGQEALEGMQVLTGMLPEGCVSDELGLVLVGENDLYGRRKKYLGQHSRKRRRDITQAGKRVSMLADIEPGCLVVHVSHGIGRYLGLTTVELNDRKQEVLEIEYAEEARVYVPVAQSHVLSKYIGVGNKGARLHKLGSSRWSKEKASASKAVQDMAAELLETQASRDALRGHAFGEDTTWQHEFEGSFPYEETADQLRAITEIKTDMENTRPMDRLICGDVGYGKTEVAMRAAFKAVMGTKQVAVLVPTTVLAQQHFETFSDRMAAYPVNIRMLSRFCSPKEHADILDGLADGTVDIVIGTHALVQPGVMFKDLGLVIIDEEQRFGVRHKERLKQLRRLVDVITMTATPIPRTLYFSMTGVKDLSTIQTPPQDRLSVETRVEEFNEHLIRHAVLRELNRDGQVFFLHNRVTTINSMQARLRKLLPEARIDVGHGQMAAGELSRVMHRFARGDTDILLCTTIIESGVDIPNANTIIIDRADRFGMAELYQLRGRVGRSHHKAYAYLLLPPGGTSDPIARRRVQALQQYSSLGSAFNLAMRDLEIRGAGNLLGTQQSGHIAAVGFQLYCQLLRRTVAQMKGEKVPPVIEVEILLDFIDLSPLSDEDSAAVIPEDYIEDESQRVRLYRRLAEAGEKKDLTELASELKDRFGPLPPAVTRLMQVAEIRILAHQKNIRAVENREDRILLSKGRDYISDQGRLPRTTAKTADGRLKEIIRILKQL